MSPASALWNGLRTVALRPPRANPVGTGPGLFIVLIGIYFIVEIALAAIDVARPWTFAPVGVMTLLTDALLTLIAAVVIVRTMQRDDIVWGVAAILLAGTIAMAVAVHWPLGWAATWLVVHGHLIVAVFFDIVAHGWWLLVLLVVARWLGPRQLVRALIAAFVGYAVSAAVWWWLPAMPLLATSADATSTLNAAIDPETPDEDDADMTPAQDEPEFDAEQVIYNQPALLDAAVAKLAPQRPGIVDLYVVAFAGDAHEDVFRNEVEYAEQLFGKRFDAEGHVLVLENNAATVQTRPLATLTNLTWALDDVAKKMDPAEDLLLVYITSHGSHDHELLVDLDPLPLDQITPDDLADALKTKPGVRWKVVVVNACYSGGFIDALRDDSTMVITSAREDRTSFGCGAASDITYFGKAFLAEALNKTTSIPEAFEQARKSVADWEDADKEEHSEPQIASVRSIEAKLATWQRQLKAGEAVPFVRAADPAR